jgi:hypothetical protein
VEITLRDVRDSDLPVFWAQMGDERAQHMAAVTRGYHYDRAAFDAHWDKVRSDPAVIVRTVLADGEVAGHAAVFGPPDEREVTYWVDRGLLGARGRHRGPGCPTPLGAHTPAARARGRGQHRLDPRAAEVRLRDHRPGPDLRASARRGD